MKPSRTACILAAILGSLTLTTAAGAQAAEERCDASRSVRRVSFDGSPRFDDATLAASIVTKGAGIANRWFGFGNAPCADSLEVRRDALRIAVMHRSAGWFQASVLPVINQTPRGVHVHFAITPGREAILDTIVISGLPPAPEGRRSYDEPLRQLQDKIFDRARVDTTLESVLLRLRNVGFARAQRPKNSIVIDTAAATVRLDLEFAPGPRLDLGQIHVEVQGIGRDAPKADSTAVMRLIDIRPGDLFRADQILEAQRTLYRTEAFRLVIVDTVTPTVGSPDSIIDLRIAVAEARTRSARAGLGWATQDCVRLQGRIADRGFLGIGRRVEFAARASKLGVGEPADFAPGICSILRDDPFSERVNYYTGVTASNTKLFGWPVAPTISVYSERRGEPFAYLRETTIGALAEISRTIGRRSSVTSGFQYENGRTVSDPIQSCSRFGQCTPEDINQSLFGRGVTIVSVAGTHDRTNNIVDPSRGSRFRGELRGGQTSSQLAASIRFYRTTAEASAFLPIFGGIVATRLQISRAFAPGIELADGLVIPPQERLFGGGQNSVRGYQQNLLGPLIYQVNDVRDDVVDGVPIKVVSSSDTTDYVRASPRGGTALTVLNLEYRRSVRWFPLPLQVAAFVDAGNVWEVQTDPLKFGDLRATPGIGFRIGTPVGPFRLDIGYRPYEASAGRAFYFEPGTNGSGGRILCVSPGNLISSDPGASGDISECPATYRPPRNKGVLSRLAFHFGLGQAF
jgi:outer membrane protein insertion porin family/translocation and assembly module TamA